MSETEKQWSAEERARVIVLAVRKCIAQSPSECACENYVAAQLDEYADAKIDAMGRY